MRRRERRPLLRILPAVALVALTASIPAAPRAARAEALDLRRLVLQTGGPPVAMLTADVDRDGRDDLLLVTAYTYWGQTSETVIGELDGRRYEEVRVVPTLLDRREMQLWLASDGGDYRPASAPQPLPAGVVAVDVGPPEQPLLAMTGAGIAELRQRTAGDAALTLVPWIERPTLLSGSGALLPRYRFTADVDGDGARDVLFPTRDGLAVHLARNGRLQRQPTTVLSLPGTGTGKDGVVWQRFPRSEARDVQGDGIPDIVVFRHADPGARLTADTERGFDAVSVLPGLGGGLFGPPVHLSAAGDGDGDPGELLPARRAGDKPAPDAGVTLPGSLSFFGDLDGDGVAELVTQEEIDEGGGVRQEMRQVKRPVYVYRFFRVDDGRTVASAPYQEFRAAGYPFDFDWLDASPGGFRDLDGDGRHDLVTVTLDFSLWQLPKVLVARTLGAGLDFHVWRQGNDGRFREVPQARLRGKLKVNLSEARLGQFAQFAGDFDGDGRTDFVRLGSDRTVAIHRGGEGCRYPRRADATLRLEASPADPGLARVRDVDGDGRSDLLIVTPLDAGERGESRPTRIELYLTGGAS